MIYAFVDTNIWVRALTQALPGCEVEHVTRLNELISSKRIVLLMPEVVELEVEKNWRELTAKLTRELGVLEGKLTQAMDDKKIWNEIADVKQDVIALIQTSKQRKKQSAETTQKMIAELFVLPNVQRLPLTHDVTLSARKRQIAGRMPMRPDKDSGKASNDACIIESLCSYFEKPAQADELYFCSENAADFALETDGGILLHPLLANGLPTTKYVRTLRELMDFYDSRAKIEEPPKEVIEKALIRVAIVPEPPPAAGVCGVADCNRPLWWIGPYCHEHYDLQLSSMTTELRADYDSAVKEMLKSLSYREREILKLRMGLQDGYAYTREEVGHIFKMTRRQMLSRERIIMRKLWQPNRYAHIAPYLGYIELPGLATLNDTLKEPS